MVGEIIQKLEEIIKISNKEIEDTYKNQNMYPAKYITSRVKNLRKLQNSAEKTIKKLEKEEM